MARQLRIELAGGVFHVYSRGDRREPIFLDDSDRKLWLALLADVCLRCRWICHAYCMMDNHFHLVLETPEKTLSKGMHRLNGVYTQKFNYRHKLVGHLFQGRFKSILVEKETYLLELMRYVVLNPVRAKKTISELEWRWSSYRFTVGEANPPSWLDTGWILEQFHSDRKRARELFVKFVREGLGLPKIWEELKEGAILGSESFVHEVLRRYGTPGHFNKRIRRKLEREKAEPLDSYETGSRSSRKAAIAEAYSTGGYTMEEIADHFGVSKATVSRVVNALEKRS